MSFGFPLGLLLGLSAPLIIALYLLKPKRKVLQVSSILPFVVAEKDASPTSPWQRLKQNPLLWLQVLAALLLALAISRPRLTGLSLPGKTILLVVDNSLSMSVQEGKNTRLELAKEKALKFLETSARGAKVGLAITSPRPALLVAPSGVQGRVRQGIQSIGPSLAPDDMSSLASLLKSWPSKPLPEMVLVSDGAWGSSLTIPSNLKVRAIPLGTSLVNRGIVEISVEVLGENRPVKLNARLKSFGDPKPFEVEIRLNGVLFRKVDVLPDKKGEALLSEKLQAIPGEVLSLHLPPDALSQDNLVYWPIKAPEEIKIAWVGGDNLFLQKALESVGGLDIHTVSSAEAAQALSADLIIYENEGPKTWPSKGNAWMFGVYPKSVNPKPMSYPIEVEDIRPLAPFMRGLPLSGITISKLHQPELPSEFGAAAVASRIPLIFYSERPFGETVVFPFSLWDTDLVLSVGFPVIVSRLLEQVREKKASTPLIWKLKEPLSLPWPMGDAKATFLSSKQRSMGTWSPDRGSLAIPPLEEPGLLTLSSPEREIKLGFGLLSERDLDPHPKPIQLKKGGVVVSSAAEAKLGLDLFPYLLVLALLAMLAEWWTYHRLRRIV